MDTINGFPAIADKQAKILILGSMPSDSSLQQQRYYAHQRNAFWPIMFSLFNHNLEISDYPLRQQLLIKNQVAVWDVLQSCHRSGSLDTAIKMNTIQVNQFYDFFSKHNLIKQVFFNGTKAETIYMKNVLAQVSAEFAYLNYTRLPSTSPAHASLNLNQKTKIWHDEIRYIIKATRNK